jgi:hypothetical protein
MKKTLFILSILICGCSQVVIHPTTYDGTKLNYITENKTGEVVYVDSFLIIQKWFNTPSKLSWSEGRKKELIIAGYDVSPLQNLKGCSFFKAHENVYEISVRKVYFRK